MAMPVPMPHYPGEYMLPPEYYMPMHPFPAYYPLPHMMGMGPPMVRVRVQREGRLANAIVAPSNSG
jgi:hypothetical protein